MKLISKHSKTKILITYPKLFKALPINKRKRSKKGSKYKLLDKIMTNIK